MNEQGEKRFFRIGEISRLFDIGIDSLRYYERIGILSPQRTPSGYRVYGLHDLYKLSLIKDLKSLGMSMAQIKTYLEKQSLENTIAMLEDERNHLEQSIKELTNKHALINQRIKLLNEHKNIDPDTVARIHRPERRCVTLSARIEQDEEMDYAISKLHHRFEHRIQSIGNLEIGAIFGSQEIREGRLNVFNAVFFILKDDEDDFDFAMPSGTYLTTWYRGTYSNNKQAFARLSSYIENHDLKTDGAPFEIYEIDNAETQNQDEFLTRVEVRLLP